MNDGFVICGYKDQKESLPSVLESALTEELIKVTNPENRWKKSLNLLFSSLANMVSRFFVTKMKSKEVVKIQSFLHDFFRRTDQIQAVRSDSRLQNVFLMGYCHALDKMIDSFEDAESFRQNNLLKGMIHSQPYMKQILLCLDKQVQLSHKELAEQVQISESELAGFMKTTEKYEIFDSMFLQEDRYYSLAYPNGTEALKIVKEDDRPSADSYTDFLLEILDLLQDIYLRNNKETENTLRKYMDLLNRYTTKPASCERKMNELINMFNSVRFNSDILIVYEREIVKNNVTIFTRDIQSEEVFKESVIENLKKNVKYQYFVEISDRFNSEDKVEEYFQNVFLRNNKKYAADIKKNAYFWVIQKDEMRELLGNDVSDAVIFDWKIGFSCEDENISKETPYIQMKNEKVAQFREYARMKIV